LLVWPLVGREAELGLALEVLRDGSAGGMVISGGAGLGKTRLAAEVAGSADVVEWVRATRSAAAIPLGAFAALLPDGPAGAGVELLARVRAGVAERAAGRRMVLCVDDAQLLDDASAALVHQLVAAREAFAVVTVRPDEPAPDAVRALWKDELCPLIELRALDRDEVARLLEAGVGAPVDGRSAAALWERSRGNPLFLRELARDGSVELGVWRWRGVAGGGRLADLVGLRLGELPAAERAALERLAVGAPLEAALLEPAALEGLELRELALLRADGKRRTADVAHPLYAEVVRAGLAVTRVQAIERSLADAVSAAGARRRGDLPRVAAWRLAAGDGDAALFARAAERAFAASDPVTAERFARAAGEPLLLGRALAAAGRAEEAEEVLSGLAGPAAAIALARNRFWGLGRTEDALAALDPAVSDELAGHRVRLLAAAGRPADALAAAAPLLADPSAGDPARLHAVLGAVEALAMSGRAGEALALIDEWLPVAERHDGLPQLRIVLASVRGVALRLAGRLEEATAVSEGLYEAALARRSAQPWAVEAYMVGLTWLARGRVRTAIRRCRESAAVLRDVDAVGMLGVALAGLVQAAAQAGERQLAREALAEMDGTLASHRAFAPELGLARAWVAAADGELTRARALARDTATAAERRGQTAYAVAALHALTRLGEPAADELARLAGADGPGGRPAAVEGPFAPAAAAHAAALAARDGEALDAAAERFVAMDALLLAAEAAGAAAAAHRDAGREDSARRSAARANRLLAECEQARPPTLPGDPIARELTPREREIALLAAAGLSSREIAERLVVSVRTVDNHLQRAYGKLGIAGRQELANLI
jgi:DNA-binding CsgD family transcriptional regulator